MMKLNFKYTKTTTIRSFLIQSLQLSNNPKSWRTPKGEMGYPSKGNSYPNLKNNTSIAKTGQNKLKQFAEQLKSVFATKMKLKDKNLE